MTNVTKEELDELITSYGQVDSGSIRFQYNQKTQDLARELVEKIKEAERVSDYLINLHKRINDISMHLLPDLFHEQDITSIGIGTGVTLELTPYFKASLPVGMDPIKRETALVYLREKAPEIIKTEISFSFGRHEHHLAEETVDVFHHLGLDPKVFEGVHHATLTAWVKEQFLAGREVDTNALNAKIGSIVKVHATSAEEAELHRRLRAIQNTDSADPEIKGEE